MRVVTSVHSGLAASASKGVASLGAMGSSSAWDTHAVGTQAAVSEPCVLPVRPWHLMARSHGIKLGGTLDHTRTRPTMVWTGKGGTLAPLAVGEIQGSSGSGGAAPPTGDTLPHPPPEYTAWVS